MDVEGCTAALQVRLLAVELADVLFQRSKVFRGLLAPELTSFLAKTVCTYLFITLHIVILASFL